MSYLSDFEHAGFDAEVSPGTVIQTHYISDSTLGQRRVPKTHVWNVERRLGKGGFGEVRLEVLEEDNNQQRAVKRIWATGSTFRMHYERELKALLEFSKPKYKEAAVFVEFFGWFEDPESVYLAMEYVPLGDLEHNVAAMGGRLVESDVRDITVQILEGLKIMHLERFVHRDLKPKVRFPPVFFLPPSLLSSLSLSCGICVLTNGLLECLGMSRPTSVVGETGRFRIEQASNRRNRISNSDRNASVYGPGNS